METCESSPPPNLWRFTTPAKPRPLDTPITSTFMTLLLIATFYHIALGLQVVIEDYVHSAAKTPLLAAMRLSCFALAVAGILANLRIAFGG